MQVIAHNLLSQFSSRQLNITDDNKSKSSEKLSSGYRINRAADDAAGLAISEKMRWQVRGLNRASLNIEDGISLCRVADGALNETHAILQRMRELSVQAVNDTNSEKDRNAIQMEIDLLTEEVDRIANDTNFNKDIYPLRKIDYTSSAPTNALLDNDYLGVNVKIIDANTISGYTTYIDSSGKTHYQLGNGTFQIIGITNAVFDVSGKTYIENTSLSNVSIECAAGTELSVKNVQIDNHANTSYGNGSGIGEAVKFQGNGNILNAFGDNVFKGGMDNYEVYNDADDGQPYYAACAGINVGNGAELQINGTQTSTITTANAEANIGIGFDGAWPDLASAAIGSNFNENGGIIIINSGNIYAHTTRHNSGQCAMIGGGNNAQIIINGGKINVTSGEVCIGGGYTASNGRHFLGHATIKITGGEITAKTSGMSTHSSCIGYSQYCTGTIDISGGTINAEGKGASVIGGSAHSSAGDINISGGNIRATHVSFSGGTAIGAGMYGNVIVGGEDVIHSGGTVNITGGEIYASVQEDRISWRNVAIGGELNSYTTSVQPTTPGESVKVYVDGVLTDASGSSDGNGKIVYQYSNTSNIGGILQKSSDIWIQTGARSGQGMFLFLVNATAKGIGITDPALDVTSHDNASQSISRLSDAIDKVSSYRSNFGVQQNRLEHAKSIDDNSSENSQTAESRIRDTDMAAEMVNQSKHSILQQAGQSMLAQANQSTNGILQLLDLQ